MIGFLADGSPLARLLAELGTETARRIGELLRDGLALGWNPRKVAAMMRREVGMALTRALRIARTEMLRAWRQSSIQGYRDQGALIKGYRRHAQQDTRTCIACLLLDGTFYETQDEFKDHVQGAARSSRLRAPGLSWASRASRIPTCNGSRGGNGSEGLDAATQLGHPGAADV